MQLNIAERVQLIAILPNVGNYATLKIVRELREELSFTEKDHEDFGITYSADGKTVSWNKDGLKDFEFGKVSTKVIVDKLKELDSKEALTQDLYPLYEKFVSE